MPHTRMKKILIVEDDQDAADRLTAMLESDGYATSAANSLADARQQMVLHQPNVILLDLRLPDGSGLDLFDDAQLRGKAEIILMTGHASVETSVQALRLGAVDYLVKPVSSALLSRVVARAMAENDDEDDAATEMPDTDATESDARERASAGFTAATETSTLAESNLALRRRPSGSSRLMRGDSAPMRAVYAQIDKVSRTSVSVLVVGESGTGKELVAQQIHRSSRRRSGPFKALNCGAISAQLIESELFGHEKGSFTGAIKQHKGIFEQADGGTLFLDEVTEMPMDLQVRLLRVLETGTFNRVGSTATQYADVRIVAATNRNPVEAVETSILREDLYYRLNVFQILLPPLRDRREDIPCIAELIVSQIAESENRSLSISRSALEELSDYSFPGNVRELRNLIQRAAVMADGAEITHIALPRSGRAGGEYDNRTELSAPNGSGESRPREDPLALATAGAAIGSVDEIDADCVIIPIGTSLADSERLVIEATLRACGGIKEKAAVKLGISVKTLYNRLRTYGET